MRIEAYLFVDYKGQYRFAVDMFKHDIGPILESSAGYDAFWDMTMRQSPTLHELNSEDYTQIKAEFMPLITQGLKDFRRVLQINPRAKFKKEFSDGYINFVNVG